MRNGWRVVHAEHSRITVEVLARQCGQVVQPEVVALKTARCPPVPTLQQRASRAPPHRTQTSGPKTAKHSPAGHSGMLERAPMLRICAASSGKPLLKYRARLQVHWVTALERGVSWLVGRMIALFTARPTLTPAAVREVSDASATECEVGAHGAAL
jgi:hypothetical protein